MNTTAHLHMPDTKAPWKQCLRIVMALWTVIVTAQPAIAQWEAVHPDAALESSFIVSGSTILAGGSPAGLWRSLDDGKTWERVEGALNDEVVTCLHDNGWTLFCGTYEGLHASNDHGRSWARIDSAVDMRFIVSMASYDSHVVASQGSYSLTPSMFRSSDNGIRWNRVQLDITPGQPVAPLVHKGSLFLALRRSRIILSGDTGRTWTDIGFRCIDICASDSVLVYGYVNSIQFSKDDGNTWEERITGIPRDFVTVSLAATGDTVMAILNRPLPHDSMMVFMTINAGREWRPVMKNLPRWPTRYPHNLLIHGGYVYLQGGPANEIWRRSIHELVTAVEPPRPAPSAALRLEVHPNPSDGRLTLSWSSPINAERASLRVFDILGCIAVSEEIDALTSGEGSITLNALDLAPGAYLLVLTIGIQQATVLHQILKQH